MRNKISQDLRRVTPVSDARHQILSRGFTVMEVLAVLAIMGILMGLVAIDFARQRPERSLRIAQNELVTSIRKVQSDSLFSRNVNNVKPAQYYVIKFDSASPDRYVIQAITDSLSSPVVNDIETVRLPGNIVFDPVAPFKLIRPVPPSPVTPACALLVFKSPYNRTYMNYPCNATNPPFLAGDSYKQILDHVGNVSTVSATTDSDLIITLTFKNGGNSRKVMIKGVTGLVCPTVDETTCGF